MTDSGNGVGGGLESPKYILAALHQVTLYGAGGNRRSTASQELCLTAEYEIESTVDGQLGSERDDSGDRERVQRHRDQLPVELLDGFYTAPLA